MEMFKIFNLCSWLLLFHLSTAQDFNKIPDSLKRYSYIDLTYKINKNVDKSVAGHRRNYLYAKTCLLKAQKENNIEEVIYGYNMLGLVSLNFETQLKYSDSAMSVARRKMPTKLSYVYFKRGETFYSQKKLKEALNCFLIANKDSINSSTNLKTLINYSIGLIKNTQGNYKEALPIYIKCEEIARINNSPDYLVYLFGLTELYNRIDEIELSEKYTAKGLMLSKTDRFGNFYYPYFICNRGKNHYKRKEYNKAIQDLTSPLKAILINNDYSNYAENSYYIGECYRKLNQDEKAITYYKKVDSVFNKEKDIYPINITAYEHLIAYYKKKQDYKKVVYYSDQFIKADKVIDDNYKYITSKIAKTYDIQKVIYSKQAVISSLKDEKKISSVAIILLLLGIVSLGSLYYLNNRRKRKELQKQKDLFQAYRVEREKKTLSQEVENTKLDTEIVKKSTIAKIDENVVSQILSCLDQFEKEQWYLNKEYTIDSLAAEFKTNSNYLSKVINEIKNYSFTKYMNTLRIEYILEKLETDKKHLHYTIEALSEISGFNSAQTFTRAFISYTKMKPSSFIKELKNK